MPSKFQKETPQYNYPATFVKGSRTASAWPKGQFYVDIKFYVYCFKMPHRNELQNPPGSPTNLHLKLEQLRPPTKLRREIFFNHPPGEYGDVFG